MVFTTAQTTIIAILAIFVSFIMILFLFCLISSRKARRADESAQVAVLGKWKENGSLTLEVNHLPPIVSNSNNNSSYSLPSRIESDLGGSSSTRGEKRGSGLAGIGTFSATATKQGIILSPRNGNGVPIAVSPYHEPTTERGGLGNSGGGAGGIFRRSFTEIRDTFRGYDRNTDPEQGHGHGQPRRNPMPTLSKPLSWSRGISRTRSRSKSDLSENNKSRFRSDKYPNQTQHNPPPLPRKNSARSFGSANRGRVEASPRNMGQK